MSMKMFSDISTLREEIGERKNENSEENSCAIRGKVFSFGVSGPYILFQKEKNVGFLDIKVRTGKKLMSHRKQNYMSSCHDLHCVLLINPSTPYYWNCSTSLILEKRISVENSENHNTSFFYRKDMNKIYLQLKQ